MRVDCGQDKDQGGREESGDRKCRHYRRRFNRGWHAFMGVPRCLVKYFVTKSTDSEARKICRFSAS